MKRPLLVLALVCSCSLVAQGPAPAPTKAKDPAAPAVQAAPGREFVLPLFSEKGFRVMTVRGSEIRSATGGVIEMTNLHIAVFSGDAAQRVDTVLMSQAARFYPKENRASGTQAVRVVHDDIEITGEDWTYDHKTKNVSIEKKVHVVYSAPLDIRL